MESEEDYTFDTLAEATSFAPSTLKKWSGKDPNGRWKDQRDAYRTRMVQKTTEKVIEQKSTRLAQDIVEAQKTHIHAYNVYAEIATEYGEYKLDKLKELKSKRLEASDEEEKQEIESRIEKFSSVSLDYWSKVQDRSLKGKERLLGMPFHINPNAAIAEVEKLDYVVVEKNYLAELQEAVEGEA